MNLGQFLEEILDTDNIFGRINLQLLLEDTNPLELQKIKPHQLDKEWVITLARYLAEYMGERLNHICIEDLYEDSRREAHVFLEEIHKKAVRQGIDVRLEEIDQPLTYAEACQMVGTLDINEAGEISLTPLGEEIAAEMKKQIDASCSGKWIPFWLDTISFSGMVNTKKEWGQILAIHHKNLKLLKGMRSNSLPPGNYPDFGQGAKYTAFPTLGKWAQRNGIDLEI